MEKQTVIQTSANEAAPVAVQKQNPFSAVFDASELQQAIADAATKQPQESPKATQERAAKSANKPVAKPAAKAASKPYNGPINFIVRGDGARKLFAHTAAWLDLTGLIHGKSAPEALIRALGGSALSYHMKQGNMELSQGMVSLTAKGLNHFGARETGTGQQRFQQEDKDHYMLMMMSPAKVMDDRLVKSEAAIIPVSKFL